MITLNILELITDLDNKGLSLSVDKAGQLFAKGKPDALTADIKALLRQYKPELIAHLSMLATAPTIGPGPVVQAGPVQVVVYPSSILVWCDDTPFVDTIGQWAEYDQLTQSWLVLPNDTNRLVMAITQHYGINTQLAIAGLQGAK